jgi:hypothetical protein
MDPNPTLTPTVVTKPRNYKRFLIIFVIVIILLISSIWIIHLKKAGNSSLKPGGQTGLKASPNISAPTAPVMSFSGIIEAINGNNLTVSEKAGASGKEISYQVSVPASLQILTMNSGNQKSSIKDLEVGETVIIASKVDLRTVPNNQFEALSVLVLAAKSANSSTPAPSSFTK